MPEEAISISGAKNEDIKERVKLQEMNNKPVYSVKRMKEARILFIIPVSMEIESKVDAETGDLISENKPWWSFLAW